MSFISQSLIEAILIMQLAEPAAMTPKCQGAIECIPLANDLFTRDQAIEALRVLNSVLETTSQAEFNAAAESILYRCSEYEPGDEQEAFFAECRSVLDAHHGSLAEIEELQDLLEGTKTRVDWEQEERPPASAPESLRVECPAPAPEQEKPKRASSPEPAGEPRRSPAASVKKPDHQTTWILGAASVSAAASIPLTVIGTKIIIDAHNTRSTAFQTDRYLTADGADRAAFVEDFDNYVQERNRGGGAMIAVGATLGLGAVVLFTVAATRLAGRRGPRKQASTRSIRQRSIGMQTSRSGTFLAVHGRF